MKKNSTKIQNEVLTLYKKHEEKYKNALKGKIHDGELSGVVYLGHIPHGFFESEMRTYFSQFGTINRLKLSRSKKTGVSKGYAFIEFQSETVAKIVADTMNNYLMFNKLMKCSFCEPGSLHENTFKGCKTKFKPQALYHARKQHNKDSTKRQEKRRMHGISIKNTKRMALLKKYGIEFDLNSVAKNNEVVSRKRKQIESADEQKNNKDIEKSSDEIPEKKAKLSNSSEINDKSSKKDNSKEKQTTPKKDNSKEKQTTPKKDNSKEKQTTPKKDNSKEKTTPEKVLNSSKKRKLSHQSKVTPKKAVTPTKETPSTPKISVIPQNIAKKEATPKPTSPKKLAVLKIQTPKKVVETKAKVVIEKETPVKSRVSMRTRKSEINIIDEIKTPRKRKIAAVVGAIPETPSKRVTRSTAK